MDPILAAKRLPTFAERALRGAVRAALVAGRLAQASLVNDALIRFERTVQGEASGGVRPALLFSERDRIVRDARMFIESKLAARLFSVRRRDIIAVGVAPFDCIVRGRRGGLYGVLLARLPSDSRRLDRLRKYQEAARSLRTHRLVGLLIYDVRSGKTRRLASLYESAANREDGHLGPRRQIQLRENMRDVVLDGLVREA